MGNLRQIVIAVAQIEKRKKALDLYESGMGATEISRKIGAPLRTVQRWVEQAKSTGLMQSLPKDGHDSKADAKPAATAQPGNNGNGLVSILELLYSGKLGAQAWGQCVAQLQNEHYSIHNRIVSELESLLIAELTKVDEPVSMKAVHALSIALTRHMDGQMRSLNSGRGDVLDLTQAMARIKAAGGMLVIREREVPTLQAELRRLQENAPIAQQAEELEAGINPSSIPSPPTA